MVRLLFVSALALACSPIMAQKAERLKLGKEIQLFNGKDLRGWTPFLSDPNVPASDVWTVDTAEKILICRGNPAGYIKTDREYSDFILRLEWRFNPITRQAGNSGVLLRMVGKDMIWPRSIEAQLQSEAAGDFWLIEGARLDTPPERVDQGTPRHRLRTRTNEKPIGEWNTYEILCHGDRVVLKVNGETVNEGTGADLLSGRIGLQSEGSEIHFRNIRLRPIRK
ncbi:MAG: DUF1080 domain-containing protein [Chthonomonadales bacterium]|nr:DUF1080 domain-containing protein [Chthonomonadales bacterium]